MRVGRVELRRRIYGSSSRGPSGASSWRTWEARLSSASGVRGSSHATSDFGAGSESPRSTCRTACASSAERTTTEVVAVRRSRSSRCREAIISLPSGVSRISEFRSVTRAALVKGATADSLASRRRRLATFGCWSHATLRSSNDSAGRSRESAMSASEERFGESMRVRRRHGHFMVGYVYVDAVPRQTRYHLRKGVSVDWGHVAICAGAGFVAVLMATLDRGITEYRYVAAWAGRRYARASLAGYLALHAVAAVVLGILALLFLQRNINTVLSGAIYALTLAITAEGLLRAQWPRSLHQAGRVFSVMEAIQDRLSVILGQKVDRAVQTYVEGLEDDSLCQLAMDLLHQYAIPKATESGQKKLLREARANVNALHMSDIGRGFDARSNLRMVCRTIITSESETLSGKFDVTQVSD